MFPVLVILGGLLALFDGLAGNGTCSFWKSSGELISCRSSSENLLLGIGMIAVGGAWLWWRSNRD